MTQDLHHFPPSCQTVLTALAEDPLDLAPETAAHLRGCAACAETRVQWLAQQEGPATLAPAGYFDQLPSRVLRKLPAKSPARVSRPYLWAAAAMLLGAATLGGFMAGRANRNPVVEAKLPPTPADVQEVNQGDAPFHEKEEVLTEMEQLSPDQVKALLARLKDQQPKTDAR